MNNTSHVGLLGVNSQVSLGWDFIWVIDTSEALDLSAASLLVDTTLISLLSMLEAGCDVDEVKVTVLLDQLSGVLTSSLEWCYWCGNDGSASTGKLGSDETNAANVLVTVLTGEAKLRREFGADSLA